MPPLEFGRNRRAPSLPLPLALSVFVCVLGFALGATVALPAQVLATAQVILDSPDQTAELIARGSGVPVTGVGCLQTCEDGWTAEHGLVAPPPSLWERFVTQSRNFRTRVGLVPKPIAIIGRVSLAAGLVVIGVRAGEGAYRKWIAASIPAGPGGSTGCPNCQVTSEFLIPVIQGQVISGVTAPEDGWMYGYVVNTYGPATYGVASCENMEGLTTRQPAGARNLPMPGGVSCLSGGVGALHAAFVSVDDLLQDRQWQDWTNQPFDRDEENWGGRSWTSEDLKRRMLEELATGKYSEWESWLGYVLDNKNYANPFAPINEANHRCDYGTPPYRNTPNPIFPVPFAELLGPYPTSSRPSGAADTPNPYLRWGRASWQGGDRDNWNGFGFRHIQAKHSWTEDDKESTRLALADPDPSKKIEDNPTSMVYLGPEVAHDGAVCQRRVVVVYAPDADSGIPLGILTSYEAFLRPAAP
jgi:hypothetical protein